MSFKSVLTGSVLLASVSMAGSVTAQAVDEIMFCGTSQRTGADLYGPAVYTEVSGCTPTATTRALLVTRNGTVTGNGPDWLAFLNSGGVIITEWSSSDDVYNEIYGTAYAQGGFLGFCADSLMPPVKLNTSHPFWQINDIPESADNQGCGFDLTAIADGEEQVVALGQWTGGGVMLAYRAQGSGSLFLAEADWQDSDSGYADNSRQLMNAMINYGGIVPPQQITSVPSLSAVGLVMLSALMGLFGWVGRRRLGLR